MESLIHLTPKVKPQILKGTRDFLPTDMAKRNFVMDTMKRIFQKYGYDTIETPVIEYAATLTGKYGDEGNKLMYRFKDNGKRDIALRYDQTVPTARLVAMNQHNLPMPFKRYQISRVWRADKPAKGRYREFYQCDIDIIGTDSLLAEAEVTAVINDVYQALGFKEFTIKINSRVLINSMMETIGVDEAQRNEVIRRIDKIDKIGTEKVVELLKELITDKQAEAIGEVISLTGSNAEKLAALKKFDTAQIQEFLEFCEAFNIPESVIMFDPSLARGLDYYTGIIYEVIIPGLQLGSVCGGGRYDDLCSMFTNTKLSGIGVAFGFDRMLVAMEELNILQDIKLNSQVLVAYFDKESLPFALKALQEIQAKGVNAEIYFEPAKIQKQLKYADRKNIPFVVMCGSDEVTNDEVTVKIMQTGKQKTIPAMQVGTYLASFV